VEHALVVGRTDVIAEALDQPSAARRNRPFRAERRLADHPASGGINICRGSGRKGARFYRRHPAKGP
jgi:hypothetical protein